MPVCCIVPAPRPCGKPLPCKRKIDNTGSRKPAHDVSFCHFCIFATCRVCRFLLATNCCCLGITGTSALKEVVTPVRLRARSQPFPTPKKDTSMLRKFTIMAAVLALSLAFAGTAFAGKTLINGIDANYPPFAYVDKDGKPAGFDVDAMEWIAAKMGFTVKHKPMEWSTIVQSLVSKKIDMVCSGMSITEERARQVSFSDPYWTVAQVFIAKKGSGLTVEQVFTGGKKLGVQSGTSEADWLDKEKPNKPEWNYTVRFYDSAPLAIEDVINGRIDAAAMDIAPAQDAQRVKPIEVVGTFTDPEYFGIAVRKEDKELLETINKGLALLKADPYWEELKAKYLGEKH